MSDERSYLVTDGSGIRGIRQCSQPGLVNLVLVDEVALQLPQVLAGFSRQTSQGRTGR